MTLRGLLAYPVEVIMDPNTIMSEGLNFVLKARAASLRD